MAISLVLDGSHALRGNPDQDTPRPPCPDAEHLWLHAHADGSRLDVATVSDSRPRPLLSARQDVARFIKTPTQLDIWSHDYFLQLARMTRLQ